MASLDWTPHVAQEMLVHSLFPLCRRPFSLWSTSRVSHGLAPDSHSPRSIRVETKICIWTRTDLCGCSQWTRIDLCGCSQWTRIVSISVAVASGLESISDWAAVHTVHWPWDSGFLSQPAGRSSLLLFERRSCWTPLGTTDWLVLGSAFTDLQLTVYRDKSV